MKIGRELVILAVLFVTAFLALRYLRKRRFGGHTLERQRRPYGGTWEYRLIASPRPQRLRSGTRFPNPGNSKAAGRCEKGAQKKCRNFTAKAK